MGRARGMGRAHAAMVGTALLLAIGAWQFGPSADASLQEGGVEVAASPALVAPGGLLTPAEQRATASEPAELRFGPGTGYPDVAAPSAEPEPAEPEPAEPEPIESAPAVADPTSVTIPALGVGAPVDRVGLEPDGGMEIPHDIRRVGWYEPGVRPGETGSAVIAGHVDSRSQGRGALWGLKELDAGNTVTIGHADGRSTTWRVTSRTSHVKEQLPIGELFTRFGDTRLVLITCGGSFDSARGRYTHNIVVIAEPVEPAA